MNGTVAITDHGWYEFLLAQNDLDEVQLLDAVRPLGPSGAKSGRRFLQAEGTVQTTPICGFAYFARYSRLPDWLAWETFEVKERLPDA